MITSQVTPAMLEQWKALWLEHKDFLRPCRKTGEQLIAYLQALYSLEETFDPELLAIVSDSVKENAVAAAKLPEGIEPAPKVFHIPDEGNGHLLYERRGEVFAEVERITVGVDLASGWYHVEGSEDLWDRLCAYQGLDGEDIENYVTAAWYMLCRQKRELIIGHRVTVTMDRPLGSAHPRHPEMIYPVNYGYVEGILAPDGAWQDAYVLGVDSPLDTFTGRVAAVIQRLDDVEDKWVVVPDGLEITAGQIEELTRFQEQYFCSRIITGQ